MPAHSRHSSTEHADRQRGYQRSQRPMQSSRGREPYRGRSNYSHREGLQDQSRRAEVPRGPSAPPLGMQLTFLSEILLLSLLHWMFALQAFSVKFINNNHVCHMAGCMFCGLYMHPLLGICPHCMLVLAMTTEMKNTETTELHCAWCYLAFIRMYLAHHELESVIIAIVIVIPKQ